jgi:uncharacterized protein
MSKAEPNTMGPVGLVSPVSDKKRIPLIDVLRGFAVFGILVANMASYSGQPFGLDVWNQPLNRAVYILTRFFVEAKFYSLFSFLFGWGMAIQLTRSQTKESTFLPRYIRRLLVLLLFGVIHGTLIWIGDILTFYALLGFVLLLFRKRSFRFLLLATGLSLILSILLVLPIEAAETFREWYFELTSPLRMDQYAQTLYSTGTYIEITRLRIQDFVNHNLNSLYAFGNVFAMFLLGLAVGKKRLFQKLEEHLPRIRAAIIPMFIIGFIFNGIFLYTIISPDRFPPDLRRAIAVGARTIGAPILTLSYISALALLFQRDRWRKRLAVLAPVGRMALSNYILHSIVFTLLFYDYGLGLYGSIDPTYGLVLTILMFILQIRISAWWVERYKFGPLEWLWRTITYGFPQPQKVQWSLFKDKQIEKPKFSEKQLRIFFVLGAGLVLTLWGGVLFLGSKPQERGRLQPAEFYEAVAQVEPQDAADEPPSDEIIESEIVATPGIVQLPYTPVQNIPESDPSELTAAFDVDRALRYIETLTGAPYYGRQAGSSEGMKAANYIADQFAALGLEPAGDDGGFFQVFPIPFSSIDEVPALEVFPPDGSSPKHFTPHVDFNVRARGYAGEGVVEGDVVWASNCEHSDFNDLIAVEKVVLCRYVPGVESDRNAIEHGARGLLLLVDPEENPLDFGYSLKEPLVPEPIPTLWIAPNVVEAILQGGILSLQDLMLTYRGRELDSHVRIDVDLSGSEACPSETCLGRNVLGAMPGRDPFYANDVVILGAHFDHMGQTPDGTIWPGANDDASGVAVLLEIARVWLEMDYRPQRTVLFAAWDAEELGLLGSTHYVFNPEYPLAQTYAVIQLDMVGAGGNVLRIDGGNGIERQIQIAAEALGVRSVFSELGRSDHVPFQSARIPAHLLIWTDEEDEYRDYHRPLDTADRIDLSNLELSGKIALSSLLALVEGEPGVEKILDQRMNAVAVDDLTGFLSTSYRDQIPFDQSWFSDIRTLNPQEFELSITDLLFEGDQAYAQVRPRLTYTSSGDPEESEYMSGMFGVRFQHTRAGWKWAGPDLVEVELFEGSDDDDKPSWANAFSLFHPYQEEVDLKDLFSLVFPKIIDASNQLGIPLPEELRIELHRNGSEVALNTSFLLGERKQEWFGSNVVKLVLNDVINDPEILEDALIQSFLFEAGIRPDIAPWLWEGLPIVLRANRDPESIQPQHLPALYNSLFNERYLAENTSAWAAVSFLQTQHGWEGLGQVIQLIGQSCENDRCIDAEAFDSVLQTSIGMNYSTFEETWSDYWNEELGDVKEGLDLLLGERTQAINGIDEVGYLDTIDSRIPFLLSEEQLLFSRMIEQENIEYSYSGVPMIIREDGELIAQISTTAIDSLGGSAPPPSQSTYPIHFTSSGTGYLWAGAPLRVSSGNRIRIMYPIEIQDFAAEVLRHSQRIFDKISESLGFSPSTPFTLKLFADQNSYLQSIPLDEIDAGSTQLWTGINQSAKVLVPIGSDVSDLSPILTEGIIRYFLHDVGLKDGWLLRGASLYLLPELDQRTRSAEASRYLRRVLSAYNRDELFTLPDLPEDDVLNEREKTVADAQSWDATSFLFENYGIDSFSKLIRALRSGVEFSTAFVDITGLDPESFSNEWLDSYLRGHSQEEWVEIVEGFDGSKTVGHVRSLAEDRYSGRLAGSEGAQAAANYIADAFVRYGLIPVISSEPASLEDPGGVGETLEEESLTSIETEEASSELSFFQRFPIFSSELSRAPSLEIYDSNGGLLKDFNFRESFLNVPQAYTYTGPIRGELIWVRQEEYGALELSGKIVLREPTAILQDEIYQAIDSGASGLIVASEIEGQRALLRKISLPVSEPEMLSIPVLQLSRDAYYELLSFMGQSQNEDGISPLAELSGVFAEIDLPQTVPEQIDDMNVLGLLPGSDPDLSSEVVILGAHYDHVGDDPEHWYCVEGVDPSESAMQAGLCEIEPGQRYPGANDNASGVAVLLEIARIWAEAGYRPARSVLFAAWGAQEPGEVGSSYYLDNPLYPLEETIATIQLDAVGGGRGFYLQASGLFEQDGLLISRLAMLENPADSRIDLMQTSAVEAEREYQDPPSWLSWSIGVERLQSDHIPFRDSGVPSVILRWQRASEENWSMGEADEVIPEYLEASGRIAALLAMTLAR